MANAAKAEAGHDSHGHHGPKWLQHHFDTPLQQFDSAKLGMWLFLGQELLFFSGLFCAYAVFRMNYPTAFADGSAQLDKIMGAVNTVVLLFSSLTAALAVRSAQLGEKSKVNGYLAATILCAFGFLIIKYFEYMAKVDHGLPAGRARGEGDLDGVGAQGGAPGLGSSRVCRGDSVCPEAARFDGSRGVGVFEGQPMDAVCGRPADRLCVLHRRLLRVAPG